MDLWICRLGGKKINENRGTTDHRPWTTDDGVTGTHSSVRALYLLVLNCSISLQGQLANATSNLETLMRRKVMSIKPQTATINNSKQ